MTAREILGLRRDFTPQQLRANFRSLALHLHPDKTTLPADEANALCQRLIAAYTELRDGASYEDCAGARQPEGGQRQFHELRMPRQAAPTHVDDGLRATAAASLGGGSGGRSNFDIQRFNSVFERTRVRDPSTDDGYGDWMHKVTPEHVAAQQAIRRGVQAYTEPEPLVSCRGLQYSEIGVSKTRDYGRGNTAIGQGHALAFADYRAAHSVDSRVIDPDTARPRAAFGSVLELENARAAPSVPLTPAEHRAHAALDRRAANTDARRERTLRRQAVSGQTHQAAVTAALLSIAR